jgi:hypothetical protein
MPKINPSITRLLTMALLVTSAFADSITLKSGERIEGKVTKETDKDITIESQSGGIVDERVVARADIEKIDKMAADVAAYQAIERVQLGQNSFPAGQYDPYIVALQGFVTQYPSSPRAADVQKTLADFKAEQKRVETGEAKIDGQWLKKDEVEKEKVQIGGRLAFNYMKSQAAGADYVGALNTFAALEKTYAGASVMPDAVELAQKLIPALKAEVERAIPEQKILKDQRDKGIKTTNSAQERATMEAAAKREDETADAAAAAAESGSRWAPFVKSNAKCLNTLLSRSGKEATRLAGLNTAKMRQSIKASETAHEYLKSGNTEGANSALKEATTLWPANELAKRLTKEVADKKTSAKAEAAAEAAAATPAPAAVKSTPKPKTTPKPSAAAQEGAAPATTAKSEDEDDRPFYMKLPGAIGIVVGLAAVLAGANVFVKMKKRKAEEAQQP